MKKLFILIGICLISVSVFGQDVESDNVYVRYNIFLRDSIIAGSYSGFISDTNDVNRRIEAYAIRDTNRVDSASWADKSDTSNVSVKALNSDSSTISDTAIYALSGGSSESHPNISLDSLLIESSNHQNYFSAYMVDNEATVASSVEGVIELNARQDNSYANYSWLQMNPDYDYCITGTCSRPAARLQSYYYPASGKVDVYDSIVMISHSTNAANTNHVTLGITRFINKVFGRDTCDYLFTKDTLFADSINAKFKSLSTEVIKSNSTSGGTEANFLIDPAIGGEMLFQNASYSTNIQNNITEAFINSEEFGVGRTNYSFATGGLVIDLKTNNDTVYCIVGENNIAIGQTYSGSNGLGLDIHDNTTNISGINSGLGMLNNRVNILADTLTCDSCKANFKTLTIDSKQAATQQYVTQATDSISYISFRTSTASDTLDLTDVGKIIRMDVATENNISVPLNSSRPYRIGTQITIQNKGVGQTTIIPISGVTINSANGATKLRLQYSVATLIKVDTNTWMLFGDITN